MTLASSTGCTPRTSHGYGTSRATEKAYKMVSGVYKIAQESRNLLWSFNLGFLIAVSVLLEGSVEDAKMTLTEVMIVARKLERDDCASFVQRVRYTIHYDLVMAGVEV
ncbi:uncharacterized protein LOC124372315 [Homalodisca vitripennis]|uniref:uncharacterized protein LOC124372315 n=1 Tax=Homalodisca vitripennis TaxID=197043 RepID=UPI001EEB3466|nr:uncharacterized protein LOC124372315 [Homalodisca vitripennis]